LYNLELLGKVIKDKK